VEACIRFVDDDDDDDDDDDSRRRRLNAELLHKLQWHMHRPAFSLARCYLP